MRDIMSRFPITILTLVIALAVPTAGADITSIAAPPSKIATLPGKVAAAPESTKADNVKRGDVVLPLEVSPFFKPQFGLAMPRL